MRNRSNLPALAARLRTFIARRPLLSLLILAAVLAVGAAAIPALNWQDTQATRTACLSNERRISTALLLYAQDHDGRLPPADYPVAEDRWRHWADIAQPYIAQQAILSCPANPAKGARNPYVGYAYPCSYALNSRFFGKFGAGPFPLENLEIPAQTALLVEGGRYRADGPYGKPSYPWALSWYWDTAWWPNIYAAPHDRKMNVAAADGHVVAIKIAHYTPEGHSPLYGRLGGAIYNWNGGHPNGDTGGAPVE